MFVTHDYNLQSIPDNFLLIPVSGKRPLGGKRWVEKCKPFSEYKNAKSLGLLLKGILAIDCDEFPEWPGFQKLPKTFGVTSGRPGRFCLFFKIPEGHRYHKVKGVDGAVEVRTGNMQQVISGGTYKWINNPQDMVDCPEWVIDLIDSGEDDNWGDVAESLQLLEQIPPADGLIGHLGLITPVEPTHTDISGSPSETTTVKGMSGSELCEFWPPGAGKKIIGRKL